MADAPTIQADLLRDFMRAVFERQGVAPDAAADAAEVLLWASLRGVDTHGVRNLLPLYTKLIGQQVIDPAAAPEIEYETPFSARANGNCGLGLSASCWAMRLAIAKAKVCGTGMVTMRNSYHFGAAGYYPWLALEHDMIGLSMTARFYARGAELGVLPTFGAKPMFSTNPIAVSFPTQEEAPYLLDMATSITPYNRIAKLRDAGESIPLGWGLDGEGRPSTDPSVIKQLLPLGGTHELGGHKGYGLSMMTEVLCAVLSGGWAAIQDEDETSFDGHRQFNDGHFFAAIRIDAFRPVDEFKRGMDAMIRALHAAPKEPGQPRIYVAGEIEHETEQTRRRDGIPLSSTVVNDLRELAARFDVEPVV
ncbi:MAG: Ldh family oxidoreductase [Caldilineaceae bacterium]|nr:Ldh family oxidoreductase [Caldilineaceae bacterium]